MLKTMRTIRGDRVVVSNLLLITITALQLYNSPPNCDPNGPEIFCTESEREVVKSLIKGGSLPLPMTTTDHAPLPSLCSL